MLEANTVAGSVCFITKHSTARGGGLRRRSEPLNDLRARTEAPIISHVRAEEPSPCECRGQSGTVAEGNCRYPR